MSAIPPELLHLLNSGPNPGQKSSNVGAFYLNDPQQEELMQDTENIRRSNKTYGQSLLDLLEQSRQSHLCDGRSQLPDEGLELNIYARPGGGVSRPLLCLLRLASFARYSSNRRVISSATSGSFSLQRWVSRSASSFCTSAKAASASIL